MVLKSRKRKKRFNLITSADIRKIQSYQRGWAECEQIKYESRCAAFVITDGGVQ